MRSVRSTMATVPHDFNVVYLGIEDPIFWPWPRVGGVASIYPKHDTPKVTTCDVALKVLYSPFSLFSATRTAQTSTLLDLWLSV